MSSIWCIAMHAAETCCSFLRSFNPFLWSIVDVITLWVGLVVRLGAGASRAQGLEKCSRPAKPLILYEYEGCPFCRKVRECLSHLDLDHMVYPCPRETLKGYGICLNSRFRQEAKNKGGECQFPFLIDPNLKPEKPIYDSDDIIKYLWATYGENATPSIRYRIASSAIWNKLTLSLCMIARPCFDMGFFRAASRNPEKPLELWGNEGSPWVRRVQETLSTLELPYLYHVVPHGSVEKRKEFRKENEQKLSGWRKRLGLIKIPFLKDPNTGKELFESSQIVEYLKQQYQTAPVQNEKWMDMINH